MRFYALPPPKDKQQFVTSVIFDSMALRNAHRGACLRLKKASWGSLPEETRGKMQRRITLTMLPGLRSMMVGKRQVTTNCWREKPIRAVAPQADSPRAFFRRGRPPRCTIVMGPCYRSRTSRQIAFCRYLFSLKSPIFSSTAEPSALWVII